jgi:endonuclease/exonuclease/phosphatase family metal-dependent hydrolase
MESVSHEPGADAGADAGPMSAKSRRFTSGRIAIFLCVIAAIFVLDGSRKIPSPPASGTSFNGPPPADAAPPASTASDAASTPNGAASPPSSASQSPNGASPSPNGASPSPNGASPSPNGASPSPIVSNPATARLRVATFNIDGGVGGTDNKFDLDRTAAAMRGFDFVGMEEVHGDLFGPDQARILGQKLNMSWLFAPVESQWWHDAFGDGAVTSLPVSFWERIPLANAGADSNRELLWTRATFAGKPLNVLVTHLERHGDRAAELRTCITLFESFEGQSILMGDFNTQKDDPQIAALRQRPDVADATGKFALGDKNPDTYDWIFARGLKATAGGFIDNGASDHALSWAEFTTAP